MAKRSLEEIYGTQGTQEKGKRSLEEIYGTSTKKTYINPMGSVEVSDVDKLKAAQYAPEPEPGFAQSVVQSLASGPLGFISQGRDIYRDLKQIPDILKGEQFQPSANRTEYDYGPLGKVESFGQVLPGKEGGEALLRGAGAGMNVASFLPGTSAVKAVATPGVALVKPTINQVSKEVARFAGLGSMGQALQEGDSVLSSVGQGALGYAGGRVLGAVPGAARGLANKIEGYSPKLLDDISLLRREGKFDEATALENSDQVQTFLKANKIDKTQIDKTLKADTENLRKELIEGASRSSGKAQLNKTERALLTSDEALRAFMENTVPTKETDNILMDTVSNIKTKQNELMETASQPLLDKLRTTGVRLADINPNNISNLVRSEMKANGVLAEDILASEAKLKAILKAEVDMARSEGRVFDITDLYKIKRNANKFYEENPTTNNKIFQRAIGNTIRKVLSRLEKTTSGESKEIITHLGKVEKEYSKLKMAEDVATQLASQVGNKPSRFVTQLLGSAGFVQGGPITGIATMMAANSLQNRMIRQKSGRILTQLAGKAQPTNYDSLIGMSKNLLNKVDAKATQNKTVRDLAKQEANNLKKREVAVNKLLETLTPKKDSELPVIEMGNTPKSKYNRVDKSLPSIRGFTSPGQVNAMTAATGIAGLASLAKSKLDGTKYQREPEPEQEPFMKPTVNENVPDINVIADRIAYAETRGEELPYSTKKWSDRTLGPASPLGRDLGKYQITSARLREKSKEFLGRRVSDEEFLKSPELQDKFIREQIKWQLGHGMTEEEIYATHRRGWGNLKPEQIKKAVATSSEYINTAKSK